MRLNILEKTWVLNPVRRWAAEYFEVPKLLSLGGSLPGARVLDVGCGGGIWTPLIKRYFQAAHVDSLDLDSTMLRSASSRAEASIVGDACNLPFADERYDAVFSLQTLHHIEDWESSLCEMKRVLRPGGKIYGLETLANLLCHPFWGSWMTHPEDNRFSEESFVLGLRGSGLQLEGVKRLGKWFLFFVATRVADKN